MAKPKPQYPPRKIVSVIFFSFLLLVAVYSFQNPKQFTITPANTEEVQSRNFLVGKVVDQSNKPLSGVRVLVSDNVASTNSEGEFTIPLTPNPYTISISKNNYQTITESIDMRGNKKVEMTFMLLPGSK